MGPTSPAETTSVSDAYALALEAYLARESDEALSEAYDLGRRALGEHFSLIDLINLHETVTLRLLAATDAPTESLKRALSASGRFLLQSVSPFAALQLNSQDSIATLRRFNSILDGEARRIAQSLHDDVFQLFAATYLELAEIRTQVPESIQARIDKVALQLDQTREQLRQLSHELRPPALDRFGLTAALTFLVESFRRRAGLEISARLPPPECRFSSRIETAVYRVAQEALTNVSRHAKYKQAELELLATDGRLDLTVKDHGVGFDTSIVRQAPDASGLGIDGMRERAVMLGGTLTLESTPGGGTQVHMSVPLQELP